jgi:hypothetical protein
VPLLRRLARRAQRPLGEPAAAKDGAVMPTRPQIIAIQKARRALQLDEADYRLILRNTGRAESSKDLSNAGVEDVMAVFEDMGHQSHPAGKSYWRDKVAARGGIANARQLHLIGQLAESSRYSLPALCARFSGGRTDCVEQLTPREAWQLTEMLKKSNARERSGTKARRHEGTEDHHVQANLPF